MYFTPDGRRHRVAEALKPAGSPRSADDGAAGAIDVPSVPGSTTRIFSIDGGFAISLRVTREAWRRSTLWPQGPRLPQAVEGWDAAGYSVSPDGGTFFVADMKPGACSWSTARRSPRWSSSDRVDPTDSIRVVTARGCTLPIAAPPISRPAAREGQRGRDRLRHAQIVATWPIPGGGSPDMGTSAWRHGLLWLSVVTITWSMPIDTATGHVQSTRWGRSPTV